MRAFVQRAILLAALGLGAVGAGASEYWISWEGDYWPENQNWTRVWGDGQGVYHGNGAHRTLANGVLTYDSLFDPNVNDFNRMSRPGQMDPNSLSGEQFVMEWRLIVNEVVGYADPGVTVRSDDSWTFGVFYAYDRMYSLSEGLLAIPFAPGVFHDYRWISADMRSYDLYIDGSLVRHGVLRQGIVSSQVTWGDTGQGAASFHAWDYFRFGVVTPEPASICALLAWCCGAVRPGAGIKAGVQT